MLVKSRQKAMAIRSTGRGARSALASADAFAEPMRSVRDGFAAPASADCPLCDAFLRSNIKTHLSGAGSVEQPAGPPESPSCGAEVGTAHGEGAERPLPQAPSPHLSPR